MYNITNIGIHIMFVKFILLISSICIFIQANDTKIQNLFNKHKIDGTLILTSLNTHKTYTHNKHRSTKEFSPASTFKILNTLIALDEKVIKDEHEIILWDGIIRDYKPWNRNHTLSSAFPISCVWCYQKLAERIGNSNYLKHLKNIHYGNQKTGKNLTNFWLQGDIRISAVEQIDFLRRLYTSSLPYKREHLRILKDIMLVEQTPKYTIWEKSGWSSNIGWHVGYVQNKDDVWFFALNMKVHSQSELKYRKQIVMESLKLKGII